MDGDGCARSSTQRVVGDEKPLSWKDGLRLVDLHELAKQMHCKTCSSLLDLINTKNETRWGLASVLSVLCCCCQTLNDIYTGKMNEIAEGKTEFEVNMKASVNLLLCGAAGQHVINFLAVLNIPKPSVDDTSITTVTSPLPHPCPGTMQTMPSNEAATSPLSLPSREPSPSAKKTTFPDAVCDRNTVSPLVIPMDRIKLERDQQEPAEANRRKASKIHSPENETPKSQPRRKKRDAAGDLKNEPPGRKREAEDSAGVVDRTMTEEGEETEDGYFDDGYSQEGFSIMQKVVRKKRYRCPVCGTVLPTTRGFHIHVVRKHQASNLQAIHHELGPDELLSADSKENSAGGAASVPPHSSVPAMASPAQSLPLSSRAGRKTHATGKSSAAPSPFVSEASTSETQDRSSDSGTSHPDVVPKKRGRRVATKLNRQCKAEDCKVSCQIGGCGQGFKTDSLYLKHVQKVHHGLKTPFACPQCPKEYKSQKSLNIHMTVAHCSKDERKAVCKYCGDTVQHRRALKKHIKTHHPRGAKKTFYCDECPMTFTQPSALKYHKLRHSGIKNYQCFYCDKMFSGSGNRLNHMRYFHEKERKFLCETCGMGFFRAYALREHERVHSGEKPYQCERCAERFTKKEYLTIHMRTHTGERPYKCELCDKAFTQRTSRSIHRRKVHGMKKQEPAGGKTQKEVVINDKIVFVNS
ncbi:hypothetical protein ACOMHN_021249 [Nucella lapillus]